MVVKYCLRTIGTSKTVGVVGCPLRRGCLSIEVNGRTIGTFRIVHYIMGVRFSGVSIKWGFTVVTPYTWLISRVFDSQASLINQPQCKLLSVSHNEGQFGHETSYIQLSVATVINIFPETDKAFSLS